MRERASYKRCGRRYPIAIVGPTASGKTAVAYELAKRIGAEIISADSMAVYKGMNIGTAKPTARQRRTVPFHMVDLLDPDEPFTVADFQERAVKTVDGLLAGHRTPLIVGGTGLYIRALIDGLNIPGPAPKPELRARLEKVALEKGRSYLHGRLAQVDPITAAKLHPNDVKRVIRALEVYEQARAPMSQIIEQTRPLAPRYPDAILFGLTMDRESLYRRIEERVDEQIRAGLVEEVAGLLARGYDPNLPAIQGLGYKEIAGHLRGLCDLETAVRELKRNSRRFAKRQYTWFRADARIDWINVDNLSPSEAADILEAKLRKAGIVGQEVGQPV